MKYDIIIVGAGIGGLITGNLLQKQGYDVLILEKNDYPGGYYANFNRGDFRFDVNLHWTCGCEKGGVLYEILKKFNGEKSVEFIKLPFLFHWIDQHNNIHFRAPTTISYYITNMIKTFPEEAANIQEFFQTFGNLTDPNVLDRLSKMQVSQIMGNIKNQNLKNLLEAPLGYFEWPPNDISGLFFAGFSMTHFSQGAYYIKGGAGSFSSALAKIFKENGGNIKYGLEAIKLKYREEIADGIVARDKEGNERDFYAKIIILNNNPTTIISRSLNGNQKLKEYTSSLEKRIPSWSAVNLYLGLNIDLKEKGITDYMIWTPHNRNNSKEDLRRAFENVNYSELPIGSIAIYSNIDPTCCPKGKSIVSIYCPAIIEPFRKFSDNKEEYLSLKKRISDDILEIVSKILKIPDLKKYIEVLELATPLTFAKYSNEINGAVMGWQMTTEQFVLNPISPKTPISNLFLSGQWASRTGGSPAIAQTADLLSGLINRYLSHK
ncbi:MAG: phytoene desaturase family protein [Promethearchaeota archaeon]